MATTEVKIAPENIQAASKPSERVAEPGVVVIFGASGDLTKRKLLPALFHLEQQGLLPKEFAIVGVARRDLKASFADDMKDGILRYGGGEKGDKVIDEFIEKVDYHAMNFDDDKGYERTERPARADRQGTRHEGQSACSISRSLRNTSRTLSITSARMGWLIRKRAMRE